MNRTRIREERPLLLWHGGLIFNEGQTSLARVGVEIIHGNFIVPAPEVGAWICHAKASAITPSEVRVDWILSIECDAVL